MTTTFRRVKKKLDKIKNEIEIIAKCNIESKRKRSSLCNCICHVNLERTESPSFAAFQWGREGNG
jgi:hypothetical protein